MKLDHTDEENKRDRIRHDLDMNLFIEAGAGAGKTSLLVDRVTNLLQKPGVRPEEIVVITFTNAAAGELYERVAGRLRKIAAEDGASEQIREAYAHLDRIYISTIHHFCHEILSQRTFDANLVLDLQMEEADDTIARQDRFLDQYMASATGNTLRDIRAVYGNNYVSCIRDTFHRLADRKDAEYVCDEKVASVSADERRAEAYVICKKIDDKISEVRTDLAAEGIVPEFSNSQGGREAYQKLGKAVSRYETGANRDLVFTAWKFFNGNDPQLFGLKEFKKAQKDLIKEANASVIASAKNWVGEWLPEFEEWKADLVLHYVQGAADAWQQQPESKYISNDRLLYETKDLLQNTAARQYLKRKYRYLFVDEYQDTDDMQTEIIWDLAMDEADHDRLQDGALVVVGDPKQAIYRFRGADSTLFEKTRKRMQDLPNVLDVTLQDNYRSAGSVIGWVNERFGALWKDGGNRYVEMREGSGRKSFGLEESKGSFLCGTYFCRVPKTKEKPHDRSALVRLIRDLTDGTHQIAVKNDTATGYGLKTVGYEDILVLTWYTTDIPQYVKAFKTEGIPANVYGAITFEETYMRRFTALVQYLSDPEDSVLFANAKQALGHEDLNRMGDAENAKLGQMLWNLKKETSGMTAKAVVHYLEDHPEYWLDWDINITANDLYNARKSVINMVEQIEASDNNTLTEIASWTDEYIDARHEREAEIAADVKQIRLMNVHKAKGLEGHIVIIADRDDIRRYPAPYKDGRKFYEVVSYTGMDGGKPTVFRTFECNQEIREKAEAASRLDQDRLEYVAATRAAEVLIIMGEKEHTKDVPSDAPFREITAKAGLLPDINDILHPETDAEEPEDTGETDVKDKSEEQDDVSEFQPVNDNTPAGDGSPVYITLNPSRLASEDDAVDDTVDDVVSADRSPMPKASLTGRPAGNVFGTVMHRCFELLVIRSDRIFHADGQTQENEISRLIRQAMLESNADIHEEEKDSYVHFLTKLMKAFLSNAGLVGAIEDAAEVHTELGFSYNVDAPSESDFIENISPFLKGADLPGSKVWVNGTADLVLFSKDGTIRIIDYKSNARGKMPAEEFRKKMNEKYAGQLLLYRYAMARLYSVDMGKVSASLYLVDDENADL